MDTPPFARVVTDNRSYNFRVFFFCVFVFYSREPRVVVRRVENHVRRQRFRNPRHHTLQRHTRGTARPRRVMDAVVHTPHSVESGWPARTERPRD